MPADLTYREDGSAIMAVSETAAWHGEGHVKVGGRISRDELADLVPEWVAPVEARPLYGMVNGEVREMESHVQNVRLQAANGSPECTVGIVGRRKYRVVQNLAAFDMAEAIMGVREDAEVASVGLLRDGAVAFLALYLGEDYLVPGAESEKRGRYLNVVNSFDGSYALTATNSDVRIVCMNTLRWNLHSRAARRVAIRHTGDMEARLDHARAALGLADRYAQLQAVVAEHLVEVAVTPARAEEFFSSLVPLPLDEHGKQVTEGRAATNARELRELLHNVWWTNPTVAPVRDTAWGLLQAVTYHANHGTVRRGSARGSAEDSRFEALVMLDGSPIEDRAQTLLTTDALREALSAS
jgi:phage/plasmid-like protein (TIGR03299 family)